jgi:hypothetical protein
VARNIEVQHDIKESVLITGDQNRVFIQYITEGINAFPTDYAKRIENFLVEYLGAPGKPVPFGGREADLASLEDWLDDLHAAPYRLLAAEAGRGKSALLVRWMQGLSARTDLAVVFVPISIRFRTNLASVTFAALTARLAKLHSEPVPGAVNTPAEVWRGLMAEYLCRPLPDGRRFLLIVDGLDEAADWQSGPDLFPLQPPNHLRIVVSARYLAGDRGSVDWLHRLGWDHRHLALPSGLPALSREGVAQVLQQIGCPLDQLAIQVDIIGQLHRLSQGDPLLVLLYVDDIWQRGEEATRSKLEDVQHIAPGLSGYFDRWWDDQKRLWGNQSPLREPIVTAFLNLLACAFGPLRLVDLQHLGSFLQPPLHFGEFDVEDALRTLSRFIIGDGEEQGYAFHHPQLNEYFSDKLTPMTRRQINASFLEFGKQTLASLNEKSLSPEEASSYIVQYHTAHLKQSGVNAENFMALVSEGWKSAWYALEGAHGGFLNDVSLAWNKFEDINVEWIRRGELAPYIGFEVLPSISSH